MLTRPQALVLAKEILAGKARSYVSAAHALAEYLVDEEAARRLAIADVPTPTLPMFREESPPPVDSGPCAFAMGMGSSGVAAAVTPPPTIAEARPVGIGVGPQRGRFPLPFEPVTGTRAALRTRSPDDEVFECTCEKPEPPDSGAFRCGNCGERVPRKGGA